MTGIVIGVDGSDGAAAALRWAVAEGRLRRWPVTAVLAWSYVDQHHPEPSGAFDPDYDEHAAAAALDAYLTAAVGDAAATVTRVVVNDLAAPALLAASEGADLLVVGARGLGGFKGLLLGSVSSQCLDHAICPMAVIREESIAETGPARVVVGTDGSDEGRAAVAWAADEARLRGAVLVVAHAWRLPPISPYFDGMLVVDPTALEAEADRSLSAAIAAVDTAGLTVERVLAHERPEPALVAAGDGATLLVVGRRGLGKVAGFLLGSTSRRVVLHATTSVAIVPDG